MLTEDKILSCLCFFASASALKNELKISFFMDDIHWIFSFVKEWKKKIN